jgi:TolA-binding protein
LSSPDPSLPPDLLWYQLALTLEDLDRLAEAKEAFQRIVDEYPQSAYAAAARERTGGSPALFGT